MAKLGEANIGGRMVPAWLLNLTAEELDGLKWHTNKNLLDNWYFVGGGSQQGGGQFPINQKGQTSYSLSGNIFDRWNQVFTATTTAELLDDGVQISVTGGDPNVNYAVFQQKFPSGGIDLSRDICLSFICNGELYQNHGTNGNVVATISGINRGEIFVSGDTIILRFFLMSGTSYKLKAVKVEYGSHQTLAYQDEDGNWVLNEIPNYGEELAKCQRYFWNSLSPNGFSILGYALATSQASAYLLIELPVSLRDGITPSLSTINFSNLVFIGTNGQETLAHSWMIDGASAGDKVLIQCQGTFITGQTYLVVLTNSDTLSVSADI